VPFFMVVETGDIYMRVIVRDVGCDYGTDPQEIKTKRTSAVITDLRREIRLTSTRVLSPINVRYCVFFIKCKGCSRQKK